MSVDLDIGAHVGRYQLLFRLGKGGMGEVWAARRPHEAALGFRKVVALKVLRQRELNANAVLMFLDEAKAASVLQHPAIVPTVDLGRDEGLLYIAMELVQGPSLTALLQRMVIDRGTVPPALVAHIGARLSSALDYAHTRAQYHGQLLRLVHRDVSPHNVLLDVHSGEIRLTDFGVARTSIQDHESKVGTIRGKPSYMAPEQVVGGDIDHRTDLFALGIVLYETACLRRLFGRQKPLKSMDAVLKHTPRPLPKLVDGFPPALWRVIKRALNKDPDQRWQSAADFHVALMDVMRGLDGGASPSHGMVRVIDRHLNARNFDVEERLLHVEDDLRANETTAAGESEPTAGEAVTQFWPSANDPDPLAPEAIEAARTRYGALGPEASSPTPIDDATRLMAGTPSSSGSLSFSGLKRPRRRLSVSAILLAFAAVTLSAMVGWLAAQSDEPQAPIAPIPPAPPPPAPVARAQPIASEDVPPAPQPTADKEEPVRTRRNRVPLDEPRSARAVRPKRTRRVRNGKAKTEKVTYESVHRLLLRVKALDDATGTAMIVTLAEAGRNNREALDRLNRKAREFLRSRGRTD